MGPISGPSAFYSVFSPTLSPHLEFHTWPIKFSFLRSSGLTSFHWWVRKHARLIRRGKLSNKTGRQDMIYGVHVAQRGWEMK